MDAQDIFNLFGGECPQCKREIRLVTIGGLKRFLNDFTPENFHGESNEWDPTYRADDHIDGSMTFVCSEGHKTYVEHTNYGDWQ